MCWSSPATRIEVDTPLITLETDKATMDVPSTAAGTSSRCWSPRAAASPRARRWRAIESQRPGARSSRGRAGRRTGRRGRSRHAARRHRAADAPRRHRCSAPEPEAARSTQLLVLGAGPGGYTAAFRAADLGLKVTLVERWSDARRRVPERRLHSLQGAAARGQGDRRGARDERARHRLRRTAAGFRTSCATGRAASCKKLTGGLAMLAKQRKVEVVRGAAQIRQPARARSRRATASSERIRFEQCIIAAGSEAVRLPFLPQTIRASSIPPARSSCRKSGPVAGHRRRHHRAGDGLRVRRARRQGQRRGAHVAAHARLRCRIWCVRSRSASSKRYGEILLNTHGDGGDVSARGAAGRVRGPRTVSAAPRPTITCWSRSGARPTASASAPRLPACRSSERGFIATDKQMRTNVPHIFAIGDIVGQPMLAHKATS